MIIDNIVKIKGNSRNLDHFKKLNYDIKINEYIDVCVNDLFENSHVNVNVMCDICGEIKTITYFSYFRNIKNYNFYACSKCSYLKNIKTNLEKYGVEFPIQLNEIKQKRKKNNLKKYGVDEPSKLKKIIDKVKLTKNIKYGDENYCNIEKIKQTKLEKYGTSGSVVIIENPNNEILLLKRHYSSKQQGWCLPGGRKSNKDSTLLDTIKRETFEETGLYFKKSKFNFIGTGLSVRNFNINIYYIKLNKYKKVILSEEHTDYIWTKNYEMFDLAGNTKNYIKLIENVLNINR